MKTELYTGHVPTDILYLSSTQNDMSSIKVSETIYFIAKTKSPTCRPSVSLILSLCKTIPVFFFSKLNYLCFGYFDPNNFFFDKINK